MWRIKLQKIIGNFWKIVHEWSSHLKVFSLPQVIENFRQYLLLRTDILQKTVVGCPCDIVLPVPPYYKLSIRETRNYSMNSFTRPSGHHDYYKYSFFPRTIKVWNCLLPEAIALNYSAFCRAKNYSKFCFKYCNFLVIYFYCWFFNLYLYFYFLTLLDV